MTLATDRLTAEDKLAATDQQRATVGALMHAASFGATTTIEGAACASTVEYVVRAGWLASRAAL